eukprot:15126406-Alexandrium_andersonii.AAC.1
MCIRDRSSCLALPAWSSAFRRLGPPSAHPRPGRVAAWPCPASHGERSKGEDFKLGPVCPGPVPSFLRSGPS